MDRLECQVNADQCDWSICKLQMVNRQTQLAHIGCNLVSQLDNIYVRVVLFYKYKSFRPFLIDAQEDFCAVMRKTVHGDKHVSMISTMMQHIISSSNIDHECPFVGNVTTSKLTIGDVLFKDWIPAGKYMLYVSIYGGGGMNNATILDVRVYFTIPAGGLKMF